MQYTEEDLAALTEEERAALLEEPEDEAAKVAAEAKAAEEAAAKAAADKEAEEAAKAADEAKAAEEAKAAAEAKAAEEAAEKAEAEQVEAPAEVIPTPAPAPLVAKAPENAEAQLADIAKRKDELADKFDNGDITAKELLAGMSELDKTERKIEREIERAELANSMASQAGQNAWETTVRNYVTVQHPEYSDPLRYAALDAAFAQIAATEDGKKLTGVKLLDKAREMVEKTLGKPQAATGEKPEDGAPLKGAKKDPVPTLAKVPAAVHANDTPDQFAELDALRERNYAAYEDALMKLSDTQREAYVGRS